MGGERARCLLLELGTAQGKTRRAFGGCTMGAGKQRLLFYRKVVVCVFPLSCQHSYWVFNLC